MLRVAPPKTPDVNDKTTLRIERTFNAPTQTVFDAWTSEEVLRPLVARRARLGDD